MKRLEILKPTDYPERYDELSDDKKRQILKWIAENIKPRSTINNKYSSVSLKRTMDTIYFFSNGEFKGAMLASGYRAKSTTGVKWFFNISDKSPAARKLSPYR